MTTEAPGWGDVDIDSIQDRLSQRLGVAVQDDEDLITLIATCGRDLATMGDLDRTTSLRDAREAVRDWLESE